MRGEHQFSKRAIAGMRPPRMTEGFQNGMIIRGCSFAALPACQSPCCVAAIQPPAMSEVCQVVHAVVSYHQGEESMIRVVLLQDLRNLPTT